MNDKRTSEQEPIVVVPAKRQGNPNWGKKPVAIDAAASTEEIKSPLRANDRRSELEPEDRMGRPVRVPIGSQDKLSFHQRPGYKRRVVNDVDDGARVQMFEKAGWRKVMGTSPGGDKSAGADSQMGTAVVRSVGAGRKGVLMEIPEEYYKEDQAVKQERINELEDGIKNRHKQPGYYLPDEGVSIKRR